MVARLSIPLAFLSLALTMLYFSDEQSALYEAQPIAHDDFPGRYFPVRDTIYILADRYVTVNLDSQRATLHRRGDSSLSYGISTGNDKVDKGIKTPSGIYTVQTKCPLCHSRQFNNAALYFWVGINRNVGFHGLKSNGYYRYLGKRPSSHGCIRIGREDAEELFYAVWPGVPVIVSDDNPAREFRFASHGDYNPTRDMIISDSSDGIARHLEQRLLALYSGEFYRYSNTRIFLTGRDVVNKLNIEAGSADSISALQFKTSYKRFIPPSARDNTLQYNPHIKFKPEIAGELPSKAEQPAANG